MTVNRYCVLYDMDIPDTKGTQSIKAQEIRDLVGCLNGAFC